MISGQFKMDLKSNTLCATFGECEYCPVMEASDSLSIEKSNMHV